MRISFRYQAILTKDSLNTSLNNLIGAGDRVQKGRDLVAAELNPNHYVSAYSIQRLMDDNAQFKKNADTAKGWLGHADTQLDSAVKSLSDIRHNLAIYGANDVSHDATSMANLAADVKKHYDLLMNVANTQYMNHHIFSGFQTETPPFQKRENEVSNLAYIHGKGGNVTPTSVFNDLEELQSGEYTVVVRAAGDVGYLELYDKYNNRVIVDTNGSDDTTRSSNNLGHEISFKLGENAVINTGRGVSITLPSPMPATGLRYNFTYEAGTDATYFGDSGQIISKLGFNQDVPINITGRELFMQSTHTVMGSKYNTVNGLAAGESTKFKQLDAANTGYGDSITIRGTDHLGNPVGAAGIIAPDRVNLNMSKATTEERTFTVGFGGKFYQVEIPAKGYKSMDELIYTMNKQLENARYIGSQTATDYSTSDLMAQGHNIQVNNINNNMPVEDHRLDISGSVRISADGDRLSFSTTMTGDQTSISITCGRRSVLGIENKTIAGFGKDTVFEIGNEFANNTGVAPLATTHTSVDLDKASVEFVVNGKHIVIKNLNLATSDMHREMMINQALRDAGYNHTVTANVVQNAANDYDVTFTMQDVNYDINSKLSTSVVDGGVVDYKMDQPDRRFSGNNSSTDKTLGDFTKFVEDLYGQTVDAYMEKGRLVVKDLRAGPSRMSIDIIENNQGIGYPMHDLEHVLSGDYYGVENRRINIKTTITNNAGNKDVTVEVYDPKGVLLTSVVRNGYTGEELELLYGVKITVDDKNTNAPGSTHTSDFSVDLRANPSVNFGDINVVQTGKNVNTFVSMKNLIDALENGITKEHISEPSAWRDPNLRSTAKPYFDGTFGGNYNAKFKYEIVADKDKHDFYVQNEFIKQSGDINFLPRFGTAPVNMNFDIQIYDNETGQMSTKNMSISLNGVTNKEEMTEAILKAVNDDVVLYNAGIRAVEKDGKISFESGAGSQNINIIGKDEDTIYAMGITAPENQLDAKISSTATSTFDVKYYSGGAWQTKTITVNGYTDYNDLITKLNAAPALGGTGVTATFDNNKLKFTGTVPFYVEEVNCPDDSLGIRNSTSNYMTAPFPAALDLSQDVNIEQRTLTFRYVDGLGTYSKNITLEPLEFKNMSEMVAHVQTKLNAASIPMTAYIGVDNKLAFKPVGAVTPISVEGDYSGKLGFPRTGDKTHIRVVDEDSKTVQNIYVNKANNLHDVVDGMLIAFDAGSFYATDSFTNTAGSGVRYEIPILDQAENQLLLGRTSVGNREAKADSVINFEKSLQEVHAKQQAYYLGGTENDKLAASSDYKLAQSAYEYAMSINAKILSMSILDFLR